MWWFDRGGLGSAEYDALARELGIKRPRVLATAAGPEGPVVALADRLVLRRDGRWDSVAWPDIERGGWDSTQGALTWTLADGRDDGVTLENPGRLAHLFRERVTASIVVNQPLEIRGLKGTTIVARRDLGNADGKLTWRIIPPRGRTLDARSQALAEGELERLRREYDIA